ncbi:glycerophosphodiester phosphodiesterase [Paenibacillus solisilvae]|uniref:Glycerophosphodiester phosphodiesterase n=1 Tax=Paenibacillus solisilvae TaxID=2486751 RepID=A0ABW0VSN7_9BACL
MGKTLVAAHTGCGIHPDNTLASFLEGIQLGADIVEVDVRVSHDGTPILLHDDSPYLLSHTYEQLNRYPDIQVMMNTPDELLPQQTRQYEQFAESVCRDAREQGYAGLNMNADTCRQQIVDLAHTMGLKVWVYTVNERSDMERFVRMGIDAITSRKPLMLIELLKVCMDLKKP